MEYNERAMKREVWCPDCKYVTVTSDAAPRCQHCGNKLITVVRSLDWKIITGEKNDFKGE